MGSLTLPAIAPVLAVCPYITREQTTSTVVRRKVRDTYIESFRITLVAPTITEAGRDRIIRADSWDQTGPAKGSQRIDDIVGRDETAATLPWVRAIIKAEL